MAMNHCEGVFHWTLGFGVYKDKKGAWGMSTREWPEAYRETWSLTVVNPVQVETKVGQTARIPNTNRHDNNQSISLSNRLLNSTMVSIHNVSPYT
jgi:hypothetical protein